MNNSLEIKNNEFLFILFALWKYKLPIIIFTILSSIIGYLISENLTVIKTYEAKVYPNFENEKKLMSSFKNTSKRYKIGENGISKIDEESESLNLNLETSKESVKLSFSLLSNYDVTLDLSHSKILSDYLKILNDSPINIIIDDYNELNSSLKLPDNFDPEINIRVDSAGELGESINIKFTTYNQSIQNDKIKNFINYFIIRSDIMIKKKITDLFNDIVYDYESRIMNQIKDFKYANEMSLVLIKKIINDKILQLSKENNSLEDPELIQKNIDLIDIYKKTADFSYLIPNYRMNEIAIKILEENTLVENFYKNLEAINFKTDNNNFNFFSTSKYVKERNISQNKLFIILASSLIGFVLISFISVVLHIFNRKI
tara:strand:- start:51096 stop:52214 length:1119 start_codon:yes stop_codon:yes gene_type:complete